MSIFEALLDRKKAKGVAHPDSFTHPITKDDGRDTTHIILKNPETARSDLEYLAKKMGIDLNQLAQERIDQEKAAREAERIRRIEKKEKARLSREKAFEKEFLDNYGSNEGHYLLTINGKRIHKLKSFDDIVCPECGAHLRVAGLATSIVEHGEIWTHPYNPLSTYYYAPCRADTARCPNMHDNKVIVQRIL